MPSAFARGPPPGDPTAVGSSGAVPPVRLLRVWVSEGLTQADS